MTETAAGRLGPGCPAAALEHLPDGVAVLDGEWTVCYVNPAGAALLGCDTSTLVGRNLWTALPELGGTVFHSLLLHTRSTGPPGAGTGSPVTWQGFYAPAGRWLTATAVVADGLLHLSFRETGPARAGRRAPAGADDRVTDDGVPDAGVLGRDRDADGDRLRFLAEVSDAMISTLDAGESAAQLAQLVLPRLGDWSMVSLIGDDGRPAAEAHAHTDPARRADLDTYLAGRIRGAVDDSPLVAALLSGEPVQLAIDQALVEPSLSTEAVRAAWDRLEATSCTIVPLRARGETFGALVLMISAGRPAHTEMEIATAVEVARRAAVSLDNARLYSRQLKVAETLQHSLLTPPPQPDELEIAVRYVPAATHMHVGGDWYDAFTQPDGATLLVIGDVVGHNVDAAAAMGQIRSIVRAIAYDRAGSPAQTLARVDEVLAGLAIGSLATVLVARVEQSADQARSGLRTLRWSSAGHLPPVLLRPDGTVRLLDTAAERLLGTGAASPHTDHETLLRPDDTVVFYTDGVVEHGRSGIDDGLTRLTGVLAELVHLPLDELCDQMLTRIVDGRTDDDIAVLVLRCHSRV